MLIAAGILPLATFSYNRGAWFFPLLAALAVLANVWPGFARLIAIAATPVLSVALLKVGEFRTESMWAQVGYPMAHRGLLEQLQVYGNAPQQMAFAISSDPGFMTIGSSVLSPIPIIGEAFRGSSGPVVYNDAIYGGGVLDQILPAAVEFYWVGGAISVILGFGAFGLLLGHLARISRTERDPLRLYFALLAGLWIALSLVWSISVISQLFVYLWVVPYLIVKVRRLM